MLQQGNADAASAALGALASSMVQTLEEQGVVESLMESRFLSLERLIAFYVLFHAMASRVARAWPLTFDISRSQSGLRIATTAAPVSSRSGMPRTCALRAADDSSRSRPALDSSRPAARPPSRHCRAGHRL